MQDDPLLTWLKAWLYGEGVEQDPAPAELMLPEVRRALEETHGAAHQTLEIWAQLRKSGVVPPRADARRVLGLIVEISHARGVDAVVAFADGTSQFFSRSGAALMGEDPRPEVEAAARRLIEEAGDYVGLAEREQASRRTPRPGTVQFTFLTPSGPLVATCTKRALREGTDRLMPLFEPATELIALKTDFPQAA